MHLQFHSPSDYINRHLKTLLFFKIYFRHFGLYCDRTVKDWQVKWEREKGTGLGKVRDLVLCPILTPPDYYPLVIISFRVRCGVGVRIIHTCLVWFNWIELTFVSPLGVDLLGRCEYSNRTRVWTKQPYQDPAEKVVSVRFQTNSGTVEWMTLVLVWFCLQFLVH